MRTETGVWKGVPALPAGVATCPAPAALLPVTCARSLALPLRTQYAPAVCSPQGPAGRGEELASPLGLRVRQGRVHGVRRRDERGRGLCCLRGETFPFGFRASSRPSGFSRVETQSGISTMRSNTVIGHRQGRVASAPHSVLHTRGDPGRGFRLVSRGDRRAAPTSWASRRNERWPCAGHRDPPAAQGLGLGRGAAPLGSSGSSDLLLRPLPPPRALGAGDAREVGPTKTAPHDGVQPAVAQVRQLRGQQGRDEQV